MNVLPILANLNLVAFITGMLFVMILMSVQLMNVFLLLVVPPHLLFVTIMTNVLLTLVILIRDVSLLLSFVMTMMHVPIILAPLKLDASTLLALLMTMTYVPLTNAKKMEKSLILLLIAMMKMHVLPIVVANPPDNANMKLLNAKTTMLALLILVVLNLVATTKLLFAMINLAIPSLATVIMDVNGNALSAMMKISVPLITVTLRLTAASFLTSFVMMTTSVPQISV
jgi:hypothetical protein